VEWLSNKLGERYRLPTAEEWEYAARAGSVTEYPWGEEVGKNRANCKGCGSQWDRRQTAPVGSFSQTAWGLHDVVGNVCEWTCSTHATGPASRECRAAWNFQDKTTAPTKRQGNKQNTITVLLQRKANSRVCRGGSWKHDGSRRLLTMVESDLEQSHSSKTIGFRIARD
jgi:formylglycine-generating enzyme required for sulfatase activity